MVRVETTGDLRVDQIMPVLCPLWHIRPFEECLQDEIGRFKKLKKKEIEPTGRIPVVDQGESFISGYIDNETDAYSGSLPVIIFGDHTRRIKFVDFPFAVGAEGTKILRPIEELNPKFFYYYLRCLNLEAQGYSRHYRFLKQTNVPIPFPAEQHRIVAKLEKLLAKVDACKERLEKIPAILKRFHQSVLAAACSGRLTADWREKNPQILPASNLIAKLKTHAPEKHLDVFASSADHSLPSSWICAPIGSLGRFEGGGTPSKSIASFWDGKIPWVSPKDMKTDRIVDSIDHISEEAISNSSVKMIPKGSILFVTRGMILNHTLPVSITDVQVTINQDMKALVPEIPDMREYLFLANKYLSAKMLFAVKEATHGTRRLESQVLKNWAIPVPPLDEQHEIVRRVEALFKIADDIEKRYEKAKAHVDKLTQSILAKAFRGELVPQDPADEPASELLIRIREERRKQAAERNPGRMALRPRGNH
jgi:type I restriction enzyme, S subunit